MVCVVRVGQHAGNEFVNSGEPLDDFEAVRLVNGEAHCFTQINLAVYVLLFAMLTNAFPAATQFASLPNWE